MPYRSDYLLQQRLNKSHFEEYIYFTKTMGIKGISLQEG